MLNRRRVVLIILGVIILVGLILVVKQFIVVNPENEVSQEYTPQAEISEQDLRKTIISLFFKETESGKLVEEGRLIDAKMLLENPYEAIIQMLLLGPEASSYERLIPEGTMLNKVELRGDTLFIDVTKEFLNTSSKEEQDLVIESIKKTVTLLSEVNNVAILVDGQNI